MQANLPELQNTDEKYAAALARCDQVNADLEQSREISRAAQRAAAAAQQRATAEREALTAPQPSLTAALADGKPLKDLQQTVSVHLPNIPPPQPPPAHHTTQP